ncbi:DUF2726 domain-containing protein [Margalitia sp. FSL K6-0131]|uniref:DUF2726 domain-containing protein n=1 Tax=Margalitia sp. FSL K6-0131 TaxID=2954604 RepID=UPI0030FC4EE1
MATDNPGCLGFLFRIFGITKGDKNKEEKFPFKLRDDFLSPSELSFFNILSQVIPNQFIICPKVSLQDIFFVNEKDKSSYYSYLNKISRKHVDLLICSAKTMQPVCGIELDDRSHGREDRVKRDEFVNQLFKTAKLSLIRFTNKKSYTLSEVEEKLHSIIFHHEATDIKETPIEEQFNMNQTPLCPKCQVPFILRTVKSGSNKGKQFYGCTNFPRCREIADINDDQIHTIK